MLLWDQRSRWAIPRHTHLSCPSLTRYSSGYQSKYPSTLPKVHSLARVHQFRADRVSELGPSYMSASKDMCYRQGRRCRATQLPASWYQWPALSTDDGLIQAGTRPEPPAPDATPSAYVVTPRCHQMLAVSCHHQQSPIYKLNTTRNAASKEPAYHDLPACLCL